MDRLTVAPFVATCIVIWTIISIILKLRPRRDLYEKVSKFPGPATLPLIGNAHLFIGSLEAIFDKIIQITKSYPLPCRAWIGHHAFILINSPEQLKVVLNSSKTIEKAHPYVFSEPWLGTGLLTASETTMGVNLQTDSNGRYAKKVDEIAASISRRVLSPWLHPDSIFHLTKLGRDQKTNIKFMHAVTDDVIRSKKDLLLKEKLQPSSADKEESTESGIPRKKILLDHLLEVSDNSETLSDQALRDEVNTLILTGSDTTASTTSFVLLMLAYYPEVQENVFQELCEIHKVNDSETLHFTPADLTRMKYLERVIKETLRLFPNVPFIGRLVTEDLDIGEHTLPEGSEVILSIIDIHRNEKYWPDPLKFDPDRFLPEEVEKRHPYAYLPFSGGPRGCIGSKYAMMSMKILLATVVEKYVLKKDTVIPVEDLRLNWEFVLRPVDRISLRIERRKRNTPASI